MRLFGWKLLKKTADTISENRGKLKSDLERTLCPQLEMGRQLWAERRREESRVTSWPTLSRSTIYHVPCMLSFSRVACVCVCVCVQQDIFWHLHGINQKRRRPHGAHTDTHSSVRVSFGVFQRGHLINNARKLCEIVSCVDCQRVARENLL